MPDIVAIGTVSATVLNLIAIVSLAMRLEHRLATIEANIHWLIGERRAVPRE